MTSLDALVVTVALATRTHVNVPSILQSAREVGEKHEGVVASSPTPEGVGGCRALLMAHPASAGSL